MSELSQSLPGKRQNKGTAYMIAALTFTVIASVVVSLRVYIRIWVKRTFGWDDGLIIFSLVSNRLRLLFLHEADSCKLVAIVSTGFIVPEVIAGYGQPINDLSAHQLREALKWNWLASALFILNVAASKISICLFLLRVLKQTQAKLNRYFPYAMIAILTIIAVPSAGYCLGQCRPVSKLWNLEASGHCIDPRIYVRVGYANGCKRMPISSSPQG